MAKHAELANGLKFPSALPVTQGRLLDFPDDPAAVMRRLHQTHGEIAALEEDGRRVVFVFGPRYNYQVLSDTRAFHACFFPIRGPRHSAQRRLTSGILNMNGDQHKRHRRLVAGPFQKSSVVNYHPGIIELAQAMVDAWQAGEVRDIASEISQYMLRVTSSMLFGFDQQELAYAIGRRSEPWIETNHKVGMGAFVADGQIADAYHDLLRQAEEMEVLIREMIELRRSSAPGNDVLSLLLQARDEDGKGLTDEELIGQASVIFGAAHLTTAYSLTWALFLLSQHPSVAAEVVQELRATLGGAPPTLEQLDQLPLLDRAVKESMRLLPASVYSQRVTAEPVELGPFTLPRGTGVIFTPFMSHRLPEPFAQPERYLPQRWETLTPAPYVYIPFAAGPRLCLGSTLAMMTIKTTLPIILQRYRLSVVPGAAINARVISTMLAPTSGMPMVLSPTTVPFTAAPVAGNIHDLMDLSSGGAEPRSYQHAA